MSGLDDETQGCLWACIWASLMPASMWLYLPPLFLLEGRFPKAASATSQEQASITGESTPGVT